MGIRALVGLPGLNKFVYGKYLSRAPFIRGWLSKFALGDSSRMTEEMVRALTTCAQQSGAEHAIFGFLRGRLALRYRVPLEPSPASGDDSVAGTGCRFPYRMGEEISRQLPDARLVPVPDCGILAPLECPDVMTAMLFVGARWRLSS